MVRVLIRSGILIVLLSLGALIISDSETPIASPHLIRLGLGVGAALCVGGLALGVVTRVANINIWRRCPRCRRPVMRGHVYCEDHFREAIHHARDRATRQ